jgi:hypothetical protein
LIIQAIVHGTAIMVSDGSYKPLLSTNIGAAAWILEFLETLHLALENIQHRAQGMR